MKDKIFKIVVIISSIIAFVTTLGYVVAKFIIHKYGEISIQQIVFNIQTSETPISILLDNFIGALPYIGVFIVCGIVILLFTVLVNRYKTLEAVVTNFVVGFVRYLKILWGGVNKKPQTIFIIFLLAISFYSIKAIDRKLQIYNFIKQENSKFIEKHYGKLDVNEFQFSGDKKKNLIIIFAESMEKGYSDANVYGENLISELEDLYGEGQRILGYRKGPGGYFTIDGVSAQTLGMPLTQLPIEIHDMANRNKYGTFLRGTPGIFNLLKNAGYETALFAGTSEQFTHQGDFMKSHGVDNIYCKEYWIEQGYELNEKTRGAWDFNDPFVMDRFKQYLTQPKEQPFAVILETIDTHFPNGWAPEDHRTDGSFKDAVKFSSKMLSSFIGWAKTQPWYSDTVIYILGDHPFQDFNVDFTKLTKQSKNREAFSLVFNSKIKNDLILQCGYSPMDIAPTILNSMGIEFTSRLTNGRLSSSRLGLGTSLLSSDKNLVCQYGINDLNANLVKYSSFYQSLHRAE